MFGTDEDVAQLAALKCEQVDGPLLFWEDVTSVAGLETIRTVTGYISMNLPLDDISGLSGLETVSGFISLVDLAVPELDFPALKEVGGDLGLLSLDSAERISLPKLTTVGGDLDIGGTPATEIDLDALEHVQGNITISSNSNLPTLNELPSLLEAQSLEIYANEKLPQCEVDAIATRLNVTCEHCTENSAACP
jgi:hypothetical protein